MLTPLRLGLKAIQHIEHRNSHRRCSIKTSVLKIVTKFTGKHLRQSLSFNKIPGQARPATLLKKRLWHRCFPVKFVRFSRTPFLQNTTGQLLLEKYIMVPLWCTVSRLHNHCEPLRRLTFNTEVYTIKTVATQQY